jgi:signal transduction histidine kinase
VFVTALIRTRALEEQLKTLVQSSPAAILTADGAGKVLAANRAAQVLFQIPARESLEGRNIGDYIPLLSDVLKVPCGPEGFRTATQCQGRRENGEIFMANTWFSSYLIGPDVRLAAIIVDSSEEMRDREEEGLRHLIRINRIAAAAVSHEVRNLSSAISLVSGNLQARQRGTHDEDLRSLTTLVQGLERIASWELQSSTHESLDEVELQEVLDHLRIIIEPAWQEIGGDIVWPALPETSVVLAEPHGLLQVFLNLARNSHRAVQDCDVRELRISVTVEGRTVCVFFHDSGRGVPEPERLFVPFQPGSDGAGLGLYVSRAMMRNYGGDLRLQHQERGACFRVEIPVVDAHE